MATINQWLDNYLQGEIEDISTRKWNTGDYNYIVKQYEKTKNCDIARLIGTLNYDGLGVNKDIDTAIKFYEIGVSSNDMCSMNDLGYLYYYELKNTEKGIDLFMQSIMLKNSVSLENLLYIYKEENKIEEMIKLCIFWYDIHHTVKPILDYCKNNLKFFKEFMKCFSEIYKEQ